MKNKRLSNQQKVKLLMQDILASKDLNEISSLRQEMDFYLDEIEREKLNRQLKKEYAQLAQVAATTSSW